MDPMIILEKKTTPQLLKQIKKLFSVTTSKNFTIKTFHTINFKHIYISKQTCAMQPIIFLFTQKSHPNHRVFSFQLIQMKLSNLHIFCTAGKSLALPDLLSRNTSPESFTRKTTANISHEIQNYFSQKPKHHPDQNIKTH